MTEAFDYSAQAGAVMHASLPERAPAPLASLETLLAQGGDARIALDPETSRNQYGCSPTPDQGVADFASSTASSISPRGQAAAGRLRERLAEDLGRESPALVYARALERVRVRLRRLCGLEDGSDIVFAASGTDIHLLAAALVGGSPAQPLLCLSVEADETGGGVPAALAGQHFSTRTALGAAVERGVPLGPSGRYVGVAAREADGRLRAIADIETELDALVYTASKAGGRALLTLTDVSKSGLISPGVDTALALARRFPRSLDVLVDACQFRLAPESLKAYLDQGFMIAVTGSKFLTGPTFSGALLVPERLGARLKSRLLPPGLRAYSARPEWPAGWVAAAGMAEAENFGLLLRWEAALAELAAFRALPPLEVDGYMRAFSRVVRQRMDDDPAFEPLATRRLDRGPVGTVTAWDRTASIFPFLLRHTAGGRRGYLNRAEVEAVYRNLADGAGVRLGQPLKCGAREGVEVSALRLCNSARLTVEALAGGGDSALVLARALAAMDRVSRAVDLVSASA